MKEIKYLGHYRIKNDSRNYSYSLFECSYCKSQVERQTKSGRKSKYCSPQCYAKNRTLRGAYKDDVIISGYIYKYSPEHPYKTKHNYVAVHRLVAETKIGRFLESDEVVHHINGNTLDNNPDNLLIMTASDHMKHHKKSTRRTRDGKFTI